MEANTEYEEYKKRMDHFPCAFNLIDADKVTTAKLRSVQHNLDSELDINDGDEDERIIKLNFLTWVRFRLEKHDEALQLSNDVVDLTKMRNVASLGNRVFVTLQTGDEVEAMKCLKDLEKLKSENDFHTLYTDARAEQAYYYSRLGGPNNLQRAMKILSALPKTSINYAREFTLGLVYRRATNANIYCSSLARLNVKEYEQKAAECLLHVAENADNRLRSLAYAQLANLRRNYPNGKKLKLFRWLGVEELCEKALQHEQNIPSVLTQCGKAIKPINIDKAIHWLGKSVEIKENSAAYHHLGICYKRKADEAAEKRYHPARSEERRGHNGMGQVRPESQVPDQSNHVSRRSRNQQHLPASVSTLSHQVNKESMRGRKDDRMADYERGIASNRGAVVSNVPQHMGGRYGQPDYRTMHSLNRWPDELYQPMHSPNRWPDELYQTMHSPNRWPDEPYQTMHSPNRWPDELYQTMHSPNRWPDEPYQQVPENYDFQQINNQNWHLVDGYLYGSYCPSQVNCTQRQTSNQSFDMGCSQPKYMGVNNGQCFYQDVKIDVADYDSYNVVKCGAYEPIHGETIAASAPSVFNEVFENFEETREHLTTEPIGDSENCYRDDNNFCMDIMNREGNTATSPYPTMGTVAGFVSRAPEMFIPLYDDSMYWPVAGRNPRHESQRPVWGVQNLELRPEIAGAMCGAPFNAGGEGYVHGNHQYMLRGRKNNRSRGFSRGHAHSTSGSLSSVRNGRFKHVSAQRFLGRGRTAQGIGLARGNTQRVDRYDRNSNQRYERRSSSEGSWKPEASLKGSVRRCRNTLPLSKDDENVQAAQKYFKKAIELSKVNLPAVLDLGLLLKETNQIIDALKQFNSITISYNNSPTHRATVISAFEQAGLCYLQQSETEKNDAYKELGKQKLTNAVSIAAGLVRVMPELQCSHKDVWVAFTTLLTEIDKEQISDNHRLMQKFTILKLAREYGDVIEIIQKLRQTGHEDLTNPDVIKAALCSYLELGQPDNALGYHNLVAMNPAVRDSGWWDDETMRPLRLKVLLHAISARLQEINESPTVLFQQLFELIFGSCKGVCNLENDQQTDTSSSVSGDVLFVFETNEAPEEEITCPTLKSARCLKRVTTFLFGLQTEENSKVNIVVIVIVIFCPL